jgi:hypothetical protein
MRSLHRLGSPAANRRRVIFLATLVVTTALAAGLHY